MHPPNNTIGVLGAATVPTTMQLPNGQRFGLKKVEHIHHHTELFQWYLRSKTELNSSEIRNELFHPNCFFGIAHRSEADYSSLSLAQDSSASNQHFGLSKSG